MKKPKQNKLEDSIEKPVEAREKEIEKKEIEERLRRGMGRMVKLNDSTTSIVDFI